MSLLFHKLFIFIGLICSIFCFYYVSISFLRHYNIINETCINDDDNSNSISNTNIIHTNTNELLNNHIYLNSNISTIANNWKNHYNDKLITPNLFHLPIWGSFRPGIYFGMKSRTVPVSLSTGILWSSEFRSKNPQTNLRHSTSQDELTNFQWLRHNGKSFGVEHITDKNYGMEIYASYILPKVFMKDYKIKNVNKFTPTWVQRLSVSSAEQSNFTKSLLFYIGVETNNKQDGLKDSLNFNDNIEGFKILKDNTNVLGNLEDDRDLVYEGVHITSFDDSLILIGKTKQTNHFCVKINIYDIAQGKKKDSKVSYVGLANDVNTATKKIQNDSKFLKLQSKNKDTKNKKADLSTYNNDGDLKGTIDKDTSVFAIQATSTSPSYVMEIVYYENTDNKYFNIDSTSEYIEAKWTEILQHYTSAETTSDIDFWMEEAVQKFEIKFENTYKLSEKLDKKGKKKFSTKDMEVAKRSLSATLGGIGYFYGKPKFGNGIDIEADDFITKNSDKVIDCDPVSLLTATPSRTSFPRGFLWDEGFHQLLINQWDESITIQIISDWLNSMYKCDSDSINCIGGWIPREMILGDDAKSRVPDEFVTQRVNIANPPTLLLVIEKIIDRHIKDTSLDVSIDGNDNLNQNREQILIYLKKSYPFLNRWLQWFLNSQSGPINAEGSFRWRGRSKSDNKLVIKI
jgi:mannosyl-oligosaccharide glucosidase